MKTGVARDGILPVCLGGSARGLQGYTNILRKPPSDWDMACMIAAHRAPEHAQLLPHLPGAVTEIPVVEVKEGMRLAPNRVFVIPPRTDMTKTGNEFRLRTTARPPGWPKTINRFLFSLPGAIGPRAGAVVLSGLDGDRCAASKSIKATGGMTFAQSDPTIESMPREAVETRPYRPHVAGRLNREGTAGFGPRAFANREVR